MIVSGLPVRNGDRHACEVANCALDLREAVEKRFRVPHMPDRKMKIRIGLHTGEYRKSSRRFNPFGTRTEKNCIQLHQKANMP